MVLTIIVGSLIILSSFYLGYLTHKNWNTNPIISKDISEYKRHYLENKSSIYLVMTIVIFLVGLSLILMASLN